MKITAVEVVKVRVPLGRPYVIARSPTYHFENLLLRLHGEDGLVGLGEGTGLSVVDDVERTRATLREVMAPAIVGIDALDVEAILGRVTAGPAPDLWAWGPSTWRCGT